MAQTGKPRLWREGCDQFLWSLKGLLGSWWLSVPSSSFLGLWIEPSDFCVCFQPTCLYLSKLGWGSLHVTERSDKSRQNGGGDYILEHL